jgi:predicted RecA/RadA family phage recombinase
MPYERPGACVRVTAGVDTRHGDMAADDGHVGCAVKTAIPAQDVLRASRNLIVAGEAYNLRVRGVHEVDNTTLAGIAKGDFVYITTATNAISNAAGGGKVVLGKVTHLPGEQGTPSNRVRVDLEQKV